ncbi:hypothetical protein ND748_17350 [Frankia sp. AiPs1]|uniref:hypothetical protein n=1 Tax=Frankia sp. AiPs1 TaxID=573493 RepID=UPI00204388FA|nr:hypothetical protein [Frankia sp. AiPs1]MCM3923420.1 hypothetical protein [Frankia sp. AiPs1]
MGVGNSGKSVADEFREYAEILLDRDSEFDGAPSGDPPLLASDYRRALYAVLALESELERTTTSPVSDGEVEAYRLGGAAMIDRIHIAIGEAWAPRRLAAREHRRHIGRPGRPEIIDEPDEGSQPMT